MSFCAQEQVLQDSKKKKATVASELNALPALKITGIFFFSMCLREYKKIQWVVVSQERKNLSAGKSLKKITKVKWLFVIPWKCHNSGITISYPAEHSMIINNSPPTNWAPHCCRLFNSMNGVTAMTFNYNIPKWWTCLWKICPMYFPEYQRKLTPHDWFNGKNLSNTDEPRDGKLGGSIDVSAITRIFTGSAVDASHDVDLFQLNYGTRWSQIHRSLIISPQLRVLL